MSGYLRASSLAAVLASSAPSSRALALAMAPVGVPRNVDGQSRTSGKFRSRLLLPALA